MSSLALNLRQQTRNLRFRKARKIANRRPATGLRVTVAGLLEYLGVPVTIAQWKAISSPHNRPLLVIAVPGSGKTRVLALRFVWLVVERGVDPASILLLTFTRKAAAEMLRRVTKWLDAAGQSGEGLRLNGGTFHSTFSRMLRRFGDEIGIPSDFGFVDSELALEDLCVELQPHRLVKSIVPEIDTEWTKARLNSDAPLDLFARHIEPVLQEEIDKAKKKRRKTPVEGIPAVDLLVKQAVRLVSKYEDRRRDDAVLDYTDLIVKCDDLLSKSPAVRQALRKKYRHVLIDEGQDLSCKQARIVERFMGKDGSVTIVGDPHQCAFTFAGAHLKTFLTFSKRFKGVVVVVLDENFRSTQPILDAARAVLAGGTKYSFSEAYWAGLRSHTGTGTRPLLVAADTLYHEAEWIVERIKMLIEAGVKPKKIAVIARMWDHLDLIEDLLTAAKIACVRDKKTARVGQRRAERSLVALLRLAVNPRDSGALRAALQLLPRFGAKTAEAVVAFAKSRGSLRDGAVKYRGFTDSPDKVRGLHGLLAVIEKIERRGRSANRAFNVAARFFRESKAGAEAEAVIDRIGGHFLPDVDLSTALENLALGEDLAATNTGAVTLAVPHTAKSKEWEHVFITRLIEGGFPHRRGRKREERRLLYISMTRAKTGLYLSYSLQAEDFQRQPVPSVRSPFLEDLDDFFTLTYAADELPAHEGWG